jgi:hypothetical protein
VGNNPPSRVLDHFWTMWLRHLLHWLNSNGSSILEVGETTGWQRHENVSTALNIWILAKGSRGDLRA